MKLQAVHVYSRRDIAHNAGLSVSTINRHISQGLLTSDSDGFTDWDVIEWLRRQNEETLSAKSRAWLGDLVISPASDSATVGRSTFRT